MKVMYLYLSENSCSLSIENMENFKIDLKF